MAKMLKSWSTGFFLTCIIISTLAGACSCCTNQEAEEVIRVWNDIVSSLDTSGKVAIIFDIISHLEKETPVSAYNIRNMFPLEPFEIKNKDGTDAEATHDEDFERHKKIVNYLQILSEFDQFVNLLQQPETLDKQVKHFIYARKISRGTMTEAIISSTKSLLRTLRKISDDINTDVWSGCLRWVASRIRDNAPIQAPYVYASCDVTPGSADQTQSIQGTVLFKQQSNGNGSLWITVKLTGFDITDESRLHGFHVHETGSLEDGCSDAGAHYNPHNVQHGGPRAKVRHVGDLGNIEEADDGSVLTAFEDPQASLLGEYSIIGRAIVIHADRDDFGEGGHPDSLTSGHAGARLACCVIKETAMPVQRPVHDEM